MSVMKILTFPDPRLRTVADPVEKFDKSLKKLTDDMLETMYSEHGIGLAATQVNVHKRVIVMDISEERNEPRVFINPEFEIKSNKSLASIANPKRMTTMSAAAASSKSLTTKFRHRLLCCLWQGSANSNGS